MKSTALRILTEKWKWFCKDVQKLLFVWTKQEKILLIGLLSLFIGEFFFNASSFEPRLRTFFIGYFFGALATFAFQKDSKKENK